MVLNAAWLLGFKPIANYIMQIPEKGLVFPEVMKDKGRP